MDGPSRLTDGTQHTCLVVHDALQDPGHHTITSYHKELLGAHQRIGNPAIANTIELYRLPHTAWIRNRTRAAVRL